MITMKMIGMDAVLKGVINLPNEMRKYTAVALTRTAQEVKRELNIHTRKIFTIRKNWFSTAPFGIRLKAAEKTDNPMFAKVYNRAPWMIDHETGGTRHYNKPKPVWLYTRSGRRITLKNKRAAFAFKADTAAGPMEFGRIGKRIVPVVVYKTSVEIKPEWKFEDTGYAVARRIYPGQFDTAIKTAIDKAFL